MKNLIWIMICLISCSCATNSQTLHVYYGAYSTFPIGNATLRSSMTNSSMLACEDGYATSFNSWNRAVEEAQRTPRASRGDSDTLYQNKNKYRRAFPLPSGSTTLNIPGCTIAWPSGYFHEFPSFSVDLSKVTFPYEITKDFERTLSGNEARDLQDVKAVIAQNEKDTQEMEAMGRASYAPTAMQQPAPVVQPVPVYQPPSLPTAPTVPFPSAPARTTTICRTLSNGTVVCN